MHAPEAQGMLWGTLTAIGAMIETTKLCQQSTHQEQHNIFVGYLIWNTFCKK